MREYSHRPVPPPLLSGDEGLVDNGMTFETAPSVVITYDLNYNANEAVLDYNINFVPEGMSENLNAVGDYINRVQTEAVTRLTER